MVKETESVNLHCMLSVKKSLFQSHSYSIIIEGRLCEIEVVTVEDS